MISVASSIKFRLQDGQLASFDNLQHNDESFRGGYMSKYLQKVYSTDTITIQIKVTTTYTVKIYYSKNCWGPWVEMTTPSLEVDGATYDFYEASINFGTLSAVPMDTVQFRIAISDGVSVTDEYWISEPVKILTSTDDNLLTLEYFNTENAFEVDYTTDITHILYIEAQLKEYKPGGEMSVLDNQDEVTKIRDEVKRILTLKTEPIPRYLAEMLRVAVAMDNFFVNEVEFVAESLPEVDNTPGNMVTWSCNLTQRNVIGLNTHDIGFDCDCTNNSDMIHLEELAASGQKSFTVPEGYLIATITGYRVAGTPVVTAGITPGGTDILYSMNLNSTNNVYEVAIIGQEIAPTGDATLYVTITGAGATANIDILLIKNRP